MRTVEWVSNEYVFRSGVYLVVGKKMVSLYKSTDFIRKYMCVEEEDFDVE